MAKHEPVPEAKMLDTAPRYSQCEVIREIWRIVARMPESRDKEEVKLKLRLAMAMGKAVSYRLQSFDPDWFDEMYDRKEDIQ